MPSLLAVEVKVMEPSREVCLSDQDGVVVKVLEPSREVCLSAQDGVIPLADVSETSSPSLMEGVLLAPSNCVTTSPMPDPHQFCFEISPSNTVGDFF